MPFLAVAIDQPCGHGAGRDHLAFVEADGERMAFRPHPSAVGLGDLALQRLLQRPRLGDFQMHHDLCIGLDLQQGRIGVGAVLHLHPQPLARDRAHKGRGRRLFGLTGEPDPRGGADHGAGFLQPPLPFKDRPQRQRRQQEVVKVPAAHDQHHGAVAGKQRPAHRRRHQPREQQQVQHQQRLEHRRDEILVQRLVLGRHLEGGGVGAQHGVEHRLQQIGGLGDLVDFRDQRPAHP